MASVDTLAPLNCRRLDTRLVSCYAFLIHMGKDGCFQAYLLAVIVSKPPFHLGILENLSLCSGLFPS